MKYRIVGADGKTYGPVGLDLIRQWLAEGRVDNRTPIYVEGAANWTYVGLLPEFAPAPGVISAPRPVPAYRGTNGFATAGFVCAILSWLCCCCPLNLLALLALIFCVIALIQIGSQTEPQEGRTLALIGLVIAGLILLFSLGAGLFQLATNPSSIHWSTSF